MHRIITTIASVLLLSFFCGAQDLVITEFMYNSPGEDLEFIEFYNNSTTDLDLSEYQVVEGVNYTFGDVFLAPEAMFIITNDSLKFQRFYKQSVSEWTSGSLNNNGEQIAVTNNALDTIINFEYSDNQPWSKAADGGGSSLALCDPNSPMTDPANWRRSIEWEAIEEGVYIMASPGEYNGCTEIESLLQTEFDAKLLLEDHGVLDIEVFLDNPPDSVTKYFIDTMLSTNGTAVIGEDLIFLTDTLTFEPSVNSSQILSLEIVDDVDVESYERIEVFLSGVGSGIRAAFKINIVDNDSPLTEAVHIRGVTHSSSIKAIELSIEEDINVFEGLHFGLGSANNGGGSDGAEFSFPNFLASAGSCVYVTNDTIRFKHFFGPFDNALLIQDEELDADFNGDDAIELFENNQVIDVFGFVDEDGTDTAWEYSDGWAKRITTESSLDFNIEDWDYSGNDGLDMSTNDSSSVPYPMMCNPTAVVENYNINFSIFPNPTTGLITITSDEDLISLQAIDLMGRIVSEKHIGTYLNTLDLSDVDGGIYLIKYKTERGQGVSKVVVE